MFAPDTDEAWTSIGFSILIAFVNSLVLYITYAVLAPQGLDQKDWTLILSISGLSQIAMLVFFRSLLNAWRKPANVASTTKESETN